MELKPQVSRRDFLAATGAVVAAGRSDWPEQPARPIATEAKSPLAIDGGPKAVQEKLPPLVRWGEPERERLNAALEQNTMFYWQGPQTTLFTERFREVCPVKHVHDLLVRHGRAAHRRRGGRHRAGRRSDHHRHHRCRHRDRRHLSAGRARVRRPRAEHVQPRSGRRRAQDHAEDEGDHRGPPGRQSVPHGRAESDRRQAQARFSSKIAPRPGARSIAANRSARSATSPASRCSRSKQITCGDGGVVGSSDERFGPLLQRFGDKGANRTHPGPASSSSPRTTA